MTKRPHRQRRHHAHPECRSTDAVATQSSWFPSPLGVLGLRTWSSSVAVVWRAICVSVPSRGFGSDDSGTAETPREGRFKFPSPLVVLGLTTGRMSLGHSCHRRCVSVPSRGFGSDDPDSRARPCPTMRVSVPSRGFGSDDYLIEAGKLRAVRFPSPLGVLGLTTAAPPAPGAILRPVSVPSRGFGSDDRALDLYEAQMAYWFPSPLGVLGLTTSGACRSCGCGAGFRVSVPSRGFGSDDTLNRATLKKSVIGFPSPLGVLGLTTRE
ncbi:Uncharacterised protein [Mycobacterium tuberculosis]|nr:Uncharacterised protein [Mycobacterium tuberculosis]